MAAVAGRLRLIPAAIPFIFLCLLFVCPLSLLFWISIHEPSAMDFYGPVLTMENYRLALTDPFYQTIIMRTLWAGLIVVGACLFVGYPMALALSRLPKSWRPLATAVLLFPLMLSNVIRAYGWIAIMGRRGVLNAALGSAGLIERPLAMLYTFEAVVVALMTILLPYVIISISNSLDAVDRRYIEAAESLGAGPLRTFFKVTWPLSAPGVASGLMIAFLLMLSAYVTINVIGGPRFKLLVSLVYDSSMNFEWARAAAMAFMMLGIGLLGAAGIFALLRPGQRRGSR